MTRLSSVLYVGLVALPFPAAVQTGPIQYAAKFVCGTRQLLASPTQQSLRNAVKPGVYNTAVNILNPARDSVQFRVLLAATDSAPVAGGVFLLLPTHNLMLPPERALEVDCDDILRSAERLRRVSFLKGFVRILSERDLEVVAVYTAGPAEQLATMDVERIGPVRRADTTTTACRLPDLTITEITGPGYLANQVTRTKVRVANIGGTTANNVEVYLEDVTNTTPQRIVTANIPTIPPGADTVVALDHQYSVPQASWPQMVALVDPKGMIQECREDNNKRTVGSP